MERSKKELEIKGLALKDYFLSFEEGVKEEDLDLKTRICHIEKADGSEYYKCSIAYYNLLEYKNETVEELQEELTEAKEEPEELEEELEDIEDLDEGDPEDYDFDSKEEYEERLYD